MKTIILRCVAIIVLWVTGCVSVKFQAENFRSKEKKMITDADGKLLNTIKTVKDSTHTTMSIESKT